MVTRHKVFLSMLLSVVLTAGLAHAKGDKVWTDRDFEELGMPSTEPLPVGTEITLQNWEKYKGYMTVGMQTVLRGDHFFKWPPDGKIVVGPTIPVPLPKTYAAATEKYAGSATLVPAPAIAPGALAISGYRGGLPFPNPQEPNRAMKIEYNSWFTYFPAQTHVHAASNIIDRFHNRFVLAVEAVLGTTSYNTDKGYPEFDPLFPDILNYGYDEVLEPEESRYVAALAMHHRDPLHFPDFYVFVPALRRVLRLSQAAVCAPVVGSDSTNDDNCLNSGNCQQIPLFEATILGEKKVLFMEHMKHEAIIYDYASESLNPLYFYSTPADIDTYGWSPPKPAAGLYELRDVYLLALRRLPTLRKGYCYGTRLFYIDKENWNTHSYDYWDSQQKFWKSFFFERAIDPIPGTDDVAMVSHLNGAVFDFQNFHATAVNSIDEINRNAGKFNDRVRYGTPAGLQQIMQ